MATVPAALANSCNYMLKLHVCVWLANYLNSVAKDTYILHQAYREIFLADHLHMHVRTGVSLVKSLFKLMVCCSGNFTVLA